MWHLLARQNDRECQRVHYTVQWIAQTKKKTEMWNEALALECVCVRVQDVVIFKV